MANQTQRLGRQEWIDAGFRALVAKGAQGLGVEPIATDLGMTKGSFYWHFKDLADLKTAMLTYWEDAATARIIAQVQRHATGLSRLRALAALVHAPHDAQGGAGAEAAIRGWAQAYAPARAAVMRVDAQRMDFLHACLADIGPSQPQDAALIYAAHLGLEHLSLTTDVDPVAALLRLIDMIAVPDQ